MTSIEGTLAQLDLFGCSSCHGSCRRSTAKYSIQSVTVYLYRLDYEQKTNWEINYMHIWYINNDCPIKPVHYEEASHF